MKKRILSLVLAFAIAFGCCAASLAASGEREALVHLVAESENGKYYAVDSLGNPYAIDHGTSVGTHANLPAAFDSRAGGNIGPVIIQGPYGTCWAISIASVMEAYAVKHGLAEAGKVDFSQAHLAYFGVNSLSENPDDPTAGDGVKVNNVWDSGGNVFKALSALARWSGIANESDFPYTAITGGSFRYSEADRYNSSSGFAVESCSIFEPDETEKIKAWVYENGAATISYSHSEKYENTYDGQKNYYAPEDTYEYHTVTVVGWDDTYPAEAFAVTPEGNGAWLCQNSWGTAWGNAGYFWLSYYDKTVYRSTGFEVMPKTDLACYDAADEYEYNNLRNYTYNGAPYYTMIAANGAVKAANVFTAQSGECLTAVSFYTAQDNVGVKISVFRNLPLGYSSPSDGELVLETETEYIENTGYHTLMLPQAVNLAQGEKFAVAIELEASGAETLLPVEYAENAAGASYSSEQGQSFVDNGYGWYDAYSKDYGNVYVQAFTDSVSSVPLGETKIQLGSYPQSLVTDEELLEKLGNMELAWRNYDYYSGNGTAGSVVPNSAMKYCDVELEGQKYRAVTFTEYRPFYTEFLSKAEYSYQDENGFVPGEVYWFAYEPLTWTVIDSSKGLVLCDYAIDSRSFSDMIFAADKDGAGGIGFDEYFNDPDCSVKLNDYASSSLRSWLNQEFIETAFTAKERELIAHTTVANGELSGSEPLADTTERVFLLSYDEVTSPSSDFSSINGAVITAKGTDYAKAQGLYVNKQDGNSYWWLRTGYKYASCVTLVSYNGIVGSPDEVRATSTSYGVRPAFILDSAYSAHTVTWNTGAETVTADYLPGEKIEVPEAPSKIGYGFIGWGDEIPEFMPDCDLEFNAEWEALEYDVVYRANGGEFSNGETEITVKSLYGEALVPPAQPYRPGYLFSGWVDEQGGEPTVLNSVDGAEFSATWVESDQTLYKVRIYTMSLDGSYEMIAVERYTAKTDSTVVYVPEAMTGFSVNSQKSTLSGTVSSDGSLLLSVYYDREKYTLTVDDGENRKTESRYFGETLNIASPQKEGYTFKGWNPDAPSVMPARDLALTAKWQVNTYTLSFNTRGAKPIPSVTLEYGAPIVLPTDVPEKSGYIFLGWAPEAPQTMPAYDLELDAKFAINAALNIKEPSVSTVRYGDTLILHAQSTAVPDDAYLHWESDNDCVKITDRGDGTCAVESIATGSARVTVSLVDSSGGVIYSTDGNPIESTVELKSQSGFFWKIISFFKNLFGSERIIQY